MKTLQQKSRRNNSARIHRRPAHAQCLVEVLEPRQLLSADLSGAFGVLPAQTLNGTNVKVALQIQNTGTTRANGTLTVQVYEAPDGTAFDPATADLLTTIRPSISLRAGATTTKTLTLPVNAATAAGTYRLYAVIDSKNRFVESDESNNVAESDPLVVAQRQVDLTSSISIKSMPAVNAGSSKKATARITVTNVGSSAAPANQSVNLSVVARPSDAVDDSGDVLLSASSARINVSNLAPGASRTVNVGLTFPATITAGSFDVLSTADANQAMLETNAMNNQGTLATPLVVNTPLPASHFVTPLPVEPPSSAPVILSPAIPVAGAPNALGSPVTSAPTIPGLTIPSTLSITPIGGTSAVIPSTGGDSLANVGFSAFPSSTLSTALVVPSSAIVTPLPTIEQTSLNTESISPFAGMSPDLISSTLPLF